MRRPEVAVGAIVVEDDCLLMVQRGTEPAQGRWSIPSGRIEWGETAAEAVIRELSEETGLTGVCSDLVGWAETVSEEAHFVVFNFEVVLLDDDDPVAGSDASDVRWVPLDQIETLVLVPGLAQFLDEHGVIELIDSPTTLD
ncbi:MAG: NUDIX domain-containing protein [Actinobacteria bacterium]|nr:NUDIX domain-containing protein [Actinomycetota bacterium]